MLSYFAPVAGRQLTWDSLCPLDFSVDEKVVQDYSTEDEDRTVEVLNGWLIDDGRQDEVAGNQSQQKGQNNRHL